MEKYNERAYYYAMNAEYGKCGIKMDGSISDKEKQWRNTLFDMIMYTIEGEEHLGNNLKSQCLMYLKDLREKEAREGRL